MITKLSVSIVNRLLSNGYLAAADKEEISYGLFSILSKAFFFIVCMLLGVLFRVPLESGIFYFSFLLIKKYAGGFHASTESKCLIISSLSILFSIVVLKEIIILSVIQIPFSVITLVSAVIVCLFSPVEAKEKPLTGTEKKKFHCFTIFRVLILFIFIISLMVLNKPRIYIPIETGLFLEGVYLTAGKIKRRKNVHF